MPRRPPKRKFYRYKSGGGAIEQDGSIRFVSIIKGTVSNPRTGAFSWNKVDLSFNRAIFRLFRGKK
jgi:hypothetical protein